MQKFTAESLGSDLSDIPLNEDGGSYRRTFIFVPSEGKMMLSEYPELANVPEFVVLNNAELVFVWMIANRTSYLCRDNEPDRPKAIASALELSKLDARLPDKLKKEYREGIFPQKIMAAIQKMQLYNPSLRVRAKIISEKAFKNIEKMIDVADEELKFMAVDEKKKYADFAKTVTNTLDDLITSMENAYGVKELKVKKKTDDLTREPTLMDRVMSE